MDDRVSLNFLMEENFEQITPLGSDTNEDTIVLDGDSLTEKSIHAMPSHLEEQVMKLCRDNNELSSLLKNYRDLAKQQDDSYKDLMNNFQVEREINQILRDCITKFSNESDLNGLIKLCSDYIMYYHQPHAVTFYMHHDPLNESDDFTPTNYTHTYSFCDYDYRENKVVDLLELMQSCAQTQVPTKILSNYDLSKLLNPDVKDALFCKIQYSKRVLGFILIEFTEVKNSIDVSMLQPLVEIFSNTYSVLSITLTLASQFGDAMSKAYTDSRTGISNTRQLQQDLDTLKGQPYTIVALDIDYFKKINDTYGHDGGDIALVELAKILDKYMQGLGGKGYRDGGDEFIGVSLKSLTETEEAVKNMIEEIKNHPIYDSQNNRFFISNSAGIYATEGNEHTEIVRKKVDKLLYTSKENGRGRYTVNQTIEI